MFRGFLLVYMMLIITCYVLLMRCFIAMLTFPALTFQSAFVNITSKGNIKHGILFPLYFNSALP